MNVKEWSKMIVKDLANGSCAVCGSGDAVKQIDFEKDNVAAVSLCKRCRAMLLAELANVAADEAGANEAPKPREQKFTRENEAIIEAAANMTEAEFEDKYLTNEIDRVVFEYVRGYGEVDMTSEGIGLVTLMMDGSASEADVEHHLDSLCERGLIYRVTGKNGWYGAKYHFKDE